MTNIKQQRAIGKKPKRVARTGMQPGDPTPEYIAHMKRVIRAEKGELDTVPVPAKVDWTSLTHLLACDVDDGC